MSVRAKRISPQLAAVNNVRACRDEPFFDVKTVSDIVGEFITLQTSYWFCFELCLFFCNDIEISNKKLCKIFKPQEDTKYDVYGV
jgi:hypothetical protein